MLGRGRERRVRLLAFALEVEFCVRHVSFEERVGGVRAREAGGGGGDVRC
jgi:hypothetical protein